MVANVTNALNLKSKQTLSDIQLLLADDLTATNQLILEQLVSNVPVIQTIARHIINSGGKRLRPLLVLLSANYFGYQGQEHHELAAIIEFVHTATLLHDDVVDASKLRRGHETANQIWGNQVSVLVGDFLYSRAFQLLTRRSHVGVMKVLAQTTNAIAEGEVSQLIHRHDPNISEYVYMEIIRRKTACLFSAATEIGALLGSANSQHQLLMAEYGLHLGIAFQIIDDLLDYTADKTEMGKNMGDDLGEGRATLPLIYALQRCTAETAAIIRLAIETGDLTQLDKILVAMTQTQAQKYAFGVASRHAELALQSLLMLPDNIYRQSMEELVKFVLQRNY